MPTPRRASRPRSGPAPSRAAARRKILARAGIAAKIWKHKATATNSQVRWALDVSARDLGATGRDSSFGFGLGQADAALARLQGPSCKAAGEKCATTTECCSFTCSGKTATKMSCK
jgi:hypothetical protein